jgi:transcriptional regulator with XRE-family HTH domain
MSAREGPVERGKRRGRRLLDEAIDEFHRARLAESITQERIGKALDRSDAWVSLIESGRNEAVSVVQLAQLMACVGLELSVRAYPAGRGIRDDAQSATLERFVSLVVPPWSWASEVPIPIPGDLRAWDGVLRGPCRIGVDVETRIRDVQAVDRRVMLKLRDSHLDRALIVLPDTRSNRAMLASTAESLKPNYPIPSRAAIEALLDARDPGGNAIIVVPLRWPSR